MNSPFEVGSPLAHDRPIDDGSYSEKDFDGYHAAPINLIGDNANEDLIRRQQDMAEKFANAAHGELDGLVKPGIVNFVIHSIRNRMGSREGQNGASYITRLNSTPVVDLVPSATPSEVLEAAEAALTGKGTVLQNELARRAWGMSSAEYANLTTIGSFRRTLEEPMWDEVGELVRTDAHPVNAKDFYRVQALGFDRALRDAQHIAAMRVGAKRVLGTLDDGTVVKARTAMVVDISHQSGFERSIAREMLEAGREKEELVSELPEFQQAVRYLLQYPDSSQILARNDTVYGFNRNVADKIKTARIDTAAINILTDDL